MTSSQRVTNVEKRHNRRTKCKSPSTSHSSSSGESTITDCITESTATNINSSESEDSDMNIYIPPSSAFRLSPQIGAHIDRPISRVVIGWGSTIDLDLYMSGTVQQTQHYDYCDLKIAH